MSVFAELLKDTRLLVATAIFLIIFLILVAGGLFGLNTLQKRLIAITVVVLLWMLFYIYDRIRAGRMATALQQSVNAQADEQMLNLSPEKKRDIEQLKQELTAAIESLKRSKLGKGRRGAAALYALPWYMFIGPPAAGKTTAIENSGLDFPYGKKIRGVAGTRNCDWFFSTSGIFLDTAGRYTTEEDDKEEWYAFLDTLRKYRRRRPINGVIVGMSIADLMEAPTEEIERHATKIRRRIDELMSRLGVRFPVYLVFTKCDLLQGFIEFFQEMSKRDRDQVWGCTFSHDHLEHNEPQAVFTKEFRVLYKALLDQRMQLLGSTQSRQKRRNLYMFPLQFNALRENLSEFVARLFQPNPYQDSPIFRGFYFTSGTQEGLPIDKVIRSIAKRFNLPATAAFQEELPVEKKSYFINNLLTKIIIPDENLGGQTSRTARHRQLVHLGLVAGITLTTILFFVSVLQAFFGSRSDLEEISQKVQALSSSTTSRFDENYFRSIDELRKAITIATDDRSILDWKMSRGDDVLPYAARYYVESFRPLIKAFFFDPLERSLRMDVARNSNYDQIYGQLKSYLLATGNGCELTAPENRNFLISTINLHFNEYLKRVGSQGSTRLPETFVPANVAFFVECLATHSMIPFRADSILVATTRRLIQRPPTLGSIYQSLLYGIDGVPPFTIQQAFGDGGRAILSARSVPGQFTKVGEELVQQKIARAVGNLGKQDCVMGDVSVQLPGQLEDKNYVTRELQRLYFQDYVRHWWDFLASVEYRSFGSFSEAARTLQELAEPHSSPLWRLVEQVTDQTRFESPATGVISEIKSRLPGQQAEGPTHPVDRAFAPIHTLIVSANEGQPSRLSEILREYDAVGALVEGLSGDAGRMSKEYAARALSQPGGNEFISSLRILDRATTGIDERAKVIFEQPVRLAWSTVMAGAMEYLNERWRREVYDVFQRSLSQYYPFNRNGRGAAPRDVENFFHRQTGVLWQFYDTELNSFMAEDSWSSRTPAGLGGLSFGNGTKNAFRDAKRLWNGLFPGGVMKVQFSLTAMLPEVTGGIGPDRICLTIDGKEECYRMGPPRPANYSWPGLEGPAGARLTIISRSGSYEYANLMGPWGWFQLLERANISPITSSEFLLLWKHTMGSYVIDVKYKLRADSSNNPFAQVRTFFKFSCPPRLN